MLAISLALTVFDPRTLVGALSPVFFLIAVGFAAWAYARVHIGRAQEQAIDTWKTNFEAQRERAELATTEAAEQREAKHVALVELAAEKLKTDQTVVRQEIAQGRDEASLQIKTMEARLVGLITEQTAVLREVATAVVKSNNGTS